MRVFRVLGIIFASLGVVALVVALVLFFALPSNGKVFAVIPLALGLGWCAVGFGFLLRVQHHEKFKQGLLQAGRRVETQVESVEMNYARRLQNQHPYNILTRWTDPATGQTYIFKSDDVWYDPTPYLKDVQNSLLVYLDPRNPKRYYVDVSKLPQRV